MALEQPGWDAALQPLGADQKGAELLFTVKPQQPLRQKGMSLASGPELSLINGLQYSLQGSTAETSISLSYPLVRVAPCRV